MKQLGDGKGRCMNWGPGTRAQNSSGGRPRGGRLLAAVAAVDRAGVGRTTPMKLITQPLLPTPPCRRLSITRSQALASDSCPAPTLPPPARVRLRPAIHVHCICSLPAHLLVRAFPCNPCGLGQAAFFAPNLRDLPGMFRPRQGPPQCSVWPFPYLSGRRQKDKKTRRADH